MTKQSWVLDAIEREATARAEAKFIMTDDFRFLGLDKLQLVRLIRFYESTTGKLASEIVPE